MPNPNATQPLLSLPAPGERKSADRWDYYLYKELYLVLLFLSLALLKVLFGESWGIFLSSRAIFIYLWLATVWLFSLDGRATLVVGLIFLLSLPAVFFFPGEAEMERPAIMSLVFLALGTGQLFWEAGRSSGKDTDDEA